MKGYGTALLVVLGLWSFGLCAQERLNYRFTAVGDLESVPDGVVTALERDRAGRIWIGTTRGLVRYDGYEFVNHSADPRRPEGPIANLVRSLLLAADGRLWIGYDGGVVSVLDPRHETFVHYRLDPGGRIGAGSLSVAALAEAPDGSIFVGTRGAGVVRIVPGRGVTERRRRTPDGESPLPEDLVYALAVDGAGVVWIGCADGLRRWSGGAEAISTVWRLYDADKDEELDPVYSLRVDGDRLWIGTLSGRLALMPLDRGPTQVLPPDPRTPAAMHDTVFDIEFMPSGEAWLARAGGIEIRSRTDARILGWIPPEPNRASGLRSSDVRNILRNDDGLVWIGGFGGGVQWHDPEARWVEVLSGEPGHGGVFAAPNIAAILERANGDLWLGMRGQGLAILGPDLKLKGGRPPTADSGSVYPLAWITALAEDAQGRVWIGGRDGLYLHQDGRPIRRFGVEEGLVAISVRRLYIDRRQTLWIGTSSGLYGLDLTREEARIERHALADGRAINGEINAFAEAADGRFWAGGASGLLVRAVSGFEVIDLGVGGVAVVGLLLDRAGRLIADTNAGLRQLEADGRVSIPPGSEGLGTDFGANLLDDEAGRLWTFRYVLDRRAGRRYPLPSDVSAEFGNGWFRAYTRLRDGRLLYGGSRGLLVIQPERFQPNDMAPEVHFSRIRIGERVLPATSEAVVLPPGDRSLSLQFAARAYRQPYAIRYAYRLTGVDPDWTHVDAHERSASYRNLVPGLFQFEVRGFGPDGSAGPIRRLMVEVRPWWWERASVRWVALAVVVLLVAVVLRWRFVLLKHQAVALESLVAKRTEQLSKAKQRAEQALERLELAQSRLIEAEKLASLGRVVAGVAHEINTPLGIAITAASRVQELARDSFAALLSGQMSKKGLAAWREHFEEGQTLLLKSLTRASQLIQSFKRLAVDQASEHRRRFDLARFLEEVRTTFTPTLSRAGITLEVECPAGIELDGYPGALFQVLTNLIENAQRHAFAGGRGGRIGIRVELLDGERIGLEVADDGLGMTPEVAARAFEPFYTTRRDDGGSGLGLHLVQTLTVGLLGGEIHLETMAGQGTRLRLALPRSAPHRGGETAAPA